LKKILPDGASPKTGTSTKERECPEDKKEKDTPPWLNQEEFS